MHTSVRNMMNGGFNADDMEAGYSYRCVILTLSWFLIGCNRASLTLNLWATSVFLYCGAGYQYLYFKYIIISN